MPTSLDMPLSKLSLSAPPFFPHSPASSTDFRLVCSDARTVTIDSALLCAVSSVFRDMLDAGSGQPMCELSEPSHEVKLFVEAITEGRIPDGEFEWLALRTLMDKYDVPAVRGVLIADGWRKHKHHPLFAYAVGVVLEDHELVEEAAEASALVPLVKARKSSAWDQLEQSERGKLTDYHNRLVGRAVDFLDDYEDRSFGLCDCASGRAPRNTHDGVFQTALTQAHGQLTPSADPAALVRGEVVSRIKRCPDCDVCGKKMRRLLDELDAEWRKKAREPVRFEVEGAG
ncbi:hypothetical protein JCM8097_009320 [Rhodosporidiobolus ruineniae]